MKKYIEATRKEDELYYQGPFWIIADNFKDVHRGKFKLEATTLPCDFEGNYIADKSSKSQKTHKKLWEQLKEQYNQDSFTYYPRGRVAIYRGTAFIHINSKCNIPQVIDAIIDCYQLEGLEIEVDLNDTYQGSHYDFELK